MRLESVELREVSLPLVRPFTTSEETSVDHPAILVTANAEGLEGYGECVAGEGPWYSYETVGTAWHVLRDFILPRVLGRDLHGPLALEPLLAPTLGHNMAKAALEEALWDLEAKRQGRSVAWLLGGRRRRIPSGVSVGIEDHVDKLLPIVSRHLEEGYRRIKIKIKPGWDVAVVRALRRAFGDFPLQVDANSAYTLKQKQLLQRLDRYELLMIEQPLAHDDLLDHAKLQAGLQTPICLDESITSPDDARKALELGSCRIINIKKGRVGGLGRARAIHNLCRRRGVPVWAGGMLELGIGRAHNVALATLPNFRLPNDISATRRYYREDITEPPFELNSDGTIDVPRGAGIGVEVQWERVDSITKRKELFSP